MIAAAIIAAPVLAACILLLRKGIREQYREPAAQQHARRWEDLVWDNSVWVNPGESPDEGVERLAGPWRRGR